MPQTDVILKFTNLAALAIVLFFASFVARADVVDHLLVCPTEAACQADTTDAAMVFQPGFDGRPMAAVKATTDAMKASGKIKPTAVQMAVKG